LGHRKLRQKGPGGKTSKCFKKKRGVEKKRTQSRHTQRPKRKKRKKTSKRGIPIEKKKYDYEKVGFGLKP